MPTIVGQIGRLEKETAVFRKQLDDVNRQITDTNINEKERESLRHTARAMEADIKEKEDKLADLRKENRKTTLTAIMLFVILVLFYVLVMSPLKKQWNNKTT